MKTVTFPLVFFGLILMFGCSANKQLTVRDLEVGQSVKLTKTNGENENIIILQSSPANITYAAESDHEVHTISRNEIRRVEKLDTYYDLSANPISRAEVEKYKTNRSTWGYAIGGGVIGGAAGLVLALPFWYADVEGLPPYFVAGAGAVVGSIYFAFKGQEKDRERALEKIRYIRKAEKDLQDQVDKEKQQLEKIQEEKKRLEDELEKDKKEE